MQGRLLGLMLSAPFWLACAASLGQDSPGSKPIDVDQALDRAQGLIQQANGEDAAMLLEIALPEAKGKQRVEVMHALEKAYDIAARQAKDAGNPSDAKYYEDNLQILKKAPFYHGPSDSPAAPAAVPSANKPKPAASTKTEAAKSKPSSPSISPADAALTADSKSKPAASDSASTRKLKASVTASTADPKTNAGFKGESTLARAKLTPKPSTNRSVDPNAVAAAAKPAASPEPQVDPVLAAADFAFETKNYLVAGRLYNRLATENKLPVSRRPHLSYCKYAELVERINAGPASEAEWSKIESEIEEVRKLSPKQWYGNYLLNLLAAGRRGEPIPASDDGVRPVANDADTPTTPPSRTSFDQQEDVAPPAERSEPTTQPAGAPPVAGQNGKPVGDWKVWETASFRVLHQETEPLARQVASVAERSRVEQYRKWTGTTPARAWPSRCDIYLYPNGETFAAETKLDPETPGFSTMRMSGGIVVSRRANLRANDPQLLTASLPHEMTHLVLADTFARTKAPLWADEGMAVLSETPEARRQRIAQLAEPMQSGQVYSIADLLTMEPPRDENWSTYYNQSVALVWFLTERAGAPTFLKFVQEAAKSKKPAWEAQLRAIYRIDSFENLEQQLAKWTLSKAQAGE